VKIGEVRASRNTPAVTMVAAWIRALTGVGPAMASGSHTYSGICALLPVAAANSSSAITAAAAVPSTAPAWGRTSPNDSEPNSRKTTNMASMKPTSPMRLTTKAFLAAPA